MWQGVFFLSLLSRNFDDRLSPNCHRFVILCIVKIQQVRRLVFDNYQSCECPVSKEIKQSKRFIKRWRCCGFENNKSHLTFCSIYCFMPNNYVTKWRWDQQITKCGEINQRSLKLMTTQINPDYYINFISCEYFDSLTASFLVIYWK